MSGINWAALISRQLHRRMDHLDIAVAILAASVPQACPTCEGKPWVTQLVCCGRDGGSWRFATHAEADALRDSYINAEGHERTGTVTLCPDCPTVAKLLAIGAAVMAASNESSTGTVCLWGDTWVRGMDQLLVELKAVEP